MPGILEIDYNYEVESAEKGVIEALWGCDKLLQDQEIYNKVVDKMLTIGYEPYLEEIEKHFVKTPELLCSYYGFTAGEVKENAK